MNVLSTFDGCSIAMQSLKDMNIYPDNYFSSEIDKHAIKVSEKNHPEIKRLGDVKNVNANNLPPIDLYIGGSPCQGFSFAGKQLNFKDPRSSLFFEYVRIWKEVKIRNPNAVFLLENVRMKNEYRDIISNFLGFEPIEINASLCSAQDRKRLFWTNIEGIEQPKDQFIFMKDIVDFEVDEKYKLSGKWEQWFNKNKEQKIKKKYMSLDSQKAITMTARQYANWNGNFLTYKGGVRRLTPVECERLQSLPDNYSSGVSDSQRYKMMGNGFNSKVISHILSYHKWK